MSNICKWLHKQLEILPLIKYPFRKDQLPKNGIYFLYEKGEIWGHGGNKSRIVRIGTHKKKNFRSRICEHFLLDKRRMNFERDNPKPSDRSIFRKNIGRALLNRENDDYLQIWEIDFIERKNREKFSHKRDLIKEKELELKITKILRANFSFKYIIIEDEEERIGSKGLESSLIGTLSKCEKCKASYNWLGKYSSKKKIANGKLWQVQHLKDEPISEKNKKLIKNTRIKTISYIEHKKVIG